MDRAFKFRLFILLVASAFATSAIPAGAQEKIGNGLEIDHMVHDFGDIMLDSGPVTCTFTVTNKSDKPAVIYNVASSCGCTGVKWTREPIRPGGTGTISATYSNDEGAYPFDKNLTVYFSDVKKPVILKIRGNSLAKILPLSELYPHRFGALGLKDTEIKGGNLEQGGVKSSTVKVANLSDKSITLSFENVSPELSLKVTPNPIPPGSTADLNFTIKASRQKWGKNWYFATPAIDGIKQKKNISFWGFTKENFDNLTKEQKASGPRPVFDSSTFSFGKIKKGTVVEAVFDFKNAGKDTFIVYKADFDSGKGTCDAIPPTQPGKSAKIRMTLDTSGMASGEALTVVTLTTNSPLRPIVNLFLAGWIE